MLSPVTMRTMMPARLQSWMAPGTSSRRGSSMPTRQTRQRSFSMASRFSRSTPAGSLRLAMQMVRRPSSAKSEMAFSTVRRRASSAGLSSPSLLKYCVHSADTISAAPLVKTVRAPSCSTMVLMRLRSEEKEMPQRSGSLAGYSVRSPLYPTLSPSSLLASTSIAHSVSLPEYLTTLPKESSSTSDLNDELITVPSASVCFRSRSSDADTSVEVSSSCPPTKTRTTVMRPVVRVPVLSEQMTLVQPSVSTAGRCRTRALRRARRCVPRARHVVTTAGRPSGIAATASTTAVLK
mmetsp:Transcript_53710/g.112088  ORF Transcript_53710/g.112088 Transcript_53710/m.112088 type:complete len:293 (+) Transcript_53710:1438-2316(+)